MRHFPNSTKFIYHLHGNPSTDGCADSGYTDGKGFNFCSSGGYGWGDGTRYGDTEGGSSYLHWKSYPFALIQFWT